MIDKALRSSNPYAAPLDTARTLECIHGYSVRAIILGLLVDVVATNVAVVVVSIAAAAVLMQGGESTYAITQILQQSTSYQGMLIAIGVGGSVFGGYVTARVAQRCELRHAAATGIASILLSLVLLALLPDGQPQWALAAGLIVILPSALLGGYLARRRAGASVAR